MKKMPRHNYFKILFAINILCIANTFGAPPPPTPLIPPPGVPIDGDITVLLLAGISVGYYYFKKRTSIK